MTTLLKKAFGMASKLPLDEQDRLGDRWIAEIKSEESLKKLFDDSQNVLDFLANEALEDLEKGRTEQVDWDEL